ncbi:MAG: hypothetical protein HQM15_09570 [Deltaproteobacteria bacterium]|nr:hypothetical protein [Deltaproteobacteria bacterium]
MEYSVKTAISLPKEDFLKIEAYRKKNKKSRSEVIQEAVHQWFENHALQEKEQQYMQGYAQKPEEAQEIEPFFKAGLGAWKKEEW